MTRTVESLAGGLLGRLFGRRPAPLPAPAAAGPRAACEALEDRQYFNLFPPGMPSMIDMIPPTAVISGQPRADPSGLGTDIDILYSDINGDIVLSTIGTGDIQVIGAGNFSQFGQLQNVTSVSAGIKLARYRIPNPIVRGAYTVNILTDQVADTALNCVPAGPIGTFQAGFFTPGGGGIPPIDDPFANADVNVSVVDIPEQVATLGKGRITVRVANLSNGPTPGRVDTDLFLTPNQVLGAADTKLASLTTRRLGAGESRLMRVNVTFPDVPAGDYFVAALADAQDKFREKSEGNNIAFSTDTVAVNVPFVDLDPAFVGSLPDEVVGGQSASTRIRIFNRGTATFDLPANVTLFLSSDGLLDATVDPVAAQAANIPLRIAPGRSATVPLDFTWPTTVPDGSYRLIARVDTGAVVVDPNPTNDVEVDDDTVLIRQAFTDLAADSISVTSGPLISRVRNNQVRVRVDNLANVDFVGTVVIALSATSSSLAGEVPLTRFTANGARVPAQGQSSFTINFTLPTSLPPGTYFLRAVVDPDNAIVERDEANNNVLTVNAFPAP